MKGTGPQSESLEITSSPAVEAASTPYVEFVTPELATRWLAGARNNRTLSDALVRTIASDMAAGKFYLNPHGLLFDMSGRLADGQHRLSAVLLTGMPVSMYVTRNVPDEVLQNIDAGRPRSLADRLHMSGVGQSNQRVACVRLILCVELGNTVRMSADMYAHAEHLLGARHIEAACTYSRNKIPSALTSAAALARPIDEAKIDALLSSINRRDYRPGTEAAIARLCVRPEAKHSAARAARAFMRGLVALLTGEGLEVLHATTDGHRKLMGMRARSGLPVRFLTDVYSSVKNIKVAVRRGRCSICDGWYNVSEPIVWIGPKHGFVHDVCSK